jgi:hypothetical protein
MLHNTGALCRGALLVAASGAVAPHADAGAWSLAQGVQQWFATISREEGDFGEAWRTDDFTEIGIGDGWGFNAKFESEIRISDQYDDRSGFRLGLQKAFPIGERASFAIGASVLAGESLDGPECVGEGLEGRAAVGTSFNFGGHEGFVNVEAAHRSRGGCERSVLEFGSGIELVPTVKLGFKAWQEGGAETGSAKAELMLGWDVADMTLGFGWREEISGNFDEKGWVLSLSGNF